MTLLALTISFIRKELLGTLRQPSLMLTILVGPFVILALFGLGYKAKSSYPTILVVPDWPQLSTNKADYKEVIKDTFELVRISKNLDEARNALKTGEASIVIDVKENALDEIYAGRNAIFPVYYRNLNPVDSSYIEFSLYVYGTEFNKTVVQQGFEAAKPKPGATQKLDESVNLLDNSMKNGDMVGARTQVSVLRALVVVSAQQLDQLYLPGRSNNQTTQQKLLVKQLLDVVVKSGADQAKADLENTQKRLDALETGFNQNDLNSPAQRTQLESIRSSVRSNNEKLNRLNSIPSGVMVEPVLLKAQNQIASTVNYINFYSPAVIILLLQHIAITLAALSNVRDSQLGTIEIFRVGPVGPVQLLTAKLISFMLLILLMGCLLVALIITILGVPAINLEQNLWAILAVLAATIYASIGLGFLVAGLSRTESQAVQLSMVLMLATIFFSGFLVPITQFIEPVQYVSYFIPTAFGASELQNLLLDGQVFRLEKFIILLGVGTVYLLIGLFLYRRQYKVK